MAAEPVTFTETNSVQALRNLEAIGKNDPAKMKEPELVEWVRGRFAWIALLRLEGREKEAAEVFAGCAAYCARHGRSAEWKALKEWGCRKKKTAEPCK